MPYLRQSHNVKPVRYGSDVDVMYSIAKNSEKIFGVDPDTNCLIMPLFFGFPCLDFSGKQNHGTPAGGVAYYSGSLSFDGVDDYVTIPNSILSGMSTCAFGSWYKPDSVADNWATIFSDREDGSNRFLLAHWDDATDLKLFISISNTASTYAYTTNDVFVLRQWSYIGVVYNGNGSTNSDKLKVYIDGVEKSLTFSGTLPSSIPIITNPVYIGAEIIGANYIDGLIDEVRINNIVLTAEQTALFYARKWDLYRRVGRTYYSVAAAPSIYIPQIMIF